MSMPETARTIYDTHAAIRRLTAAGLPEPHAEAMVREQVHLIEHDLATKADLAAVQAALQTDIEKLRQETKADIEKLRQETRADIEKLRLETRADIEKLRLETKADIEKLRLEIRADLATVQGNIEAAKTDLIKWMVGINAATAVGLAGVIIAAIELL